MLLHVLAFGDKLKAKTLLVKSVYFKALTSFPIYHLIQMHLYIIIMYCGSMFDFIDDAG